MRICIFEDRGVDYLEPLTLTRPAFDLRSGAATMLERQAHYFAGDEVGVLVRAELADLCRLLHPDVHVNDFSWLRAGPTLMVNARWLPPAGATSDLKGSVVGVVQDEVAYAALPAERLTYCSANTLDDCVETWRQTLPACDAGGAMIDFPWQLVEANGQLLHRDFQGFLADEERLYQPAGLSIVGHSDQLFVDPSASIDPMVVVDTTRGPVIIDRQARVQAFSRIEGPCYLGPGSWVVGARVKGSSIGPHCRVGGEVEASILQGYVNKYHDGFLGHSYLGEWVNLAAGTQVSDLRNDYQPVTVTINASRVDTGLTKVGAIIGDHTKTGLTTLLNTGSIIGAFGSLLPSGSLLPRLVPSYCMVADGRISEGPDLGQLLTTASTVMARRGVELTPTHAALFRTLYDRTAARRYQAIRANEQRFLRRSA